MKPNKWRVWPMLMSIAFLCMVPMTGVGSHDIINFILRVVAVVVITYNLSVELCHTDGVDPK
jgi:hypothetical protein